MQKVPVPVLGGIAVFFGIVVSMTATGLFYETASLFAILGVMTIMLYVGVMDDILSLSPSMRFLVEILVVLMLNLLLLHIMLNLLLLYFEVLMLLFL